MHFSEIVNLFWGLVFVCFQDFLIHPFVCHLLSICRWNCISFFMIVLHDFAMILCSCTAWLDICANTIFEGPSSVFAWFLHIQCVSKSEKNYRTRAWKQAQNALQFYLILDLKINEEMFEKTPKIGKTIDENRMWKYKAFLLRVFSIFCDFRISLGCHVASFFVKKEGTGIKEFGFFCDLCFSLKFRRPRPLPRSILDLFWTPFWSHVGIFWDVKVSLGFILRFIEIWEKLLST